MKKRISLFLVFAMLVTLLVPLTVTTVSADDPTLITDQAGLAAMSASGNYKLANDVTISGTWNGINGFTGTLDGDGHTITVANGATINGGLFTLLNNGATVKNLNITQAGDATYTLAKPTGSGAYCFGMVAACLAASSDFNTTSVTTNPSNIITIQNVTATANIVFNSGSDTCVAVGGIAGETGIISTFENCVFSGTITDNVNRGGRDMNTYQSGYGGIIGQAIRTGGPVAITQCINNANVTGYANEGGILGHSRSWGGGATALKALVITKCVNNGTITCSQTTTGSDKRAAAGGIVGYAMVKSQDSSFATITSNINYGDVTGAGSAQYAYVAGIFGCINVSGTATLSGNINYGTLSGGYESTRQNYYNKQDGSGTLTAANNYSNPTADAVPTLNAAYPDVYVFKDNKVKLAWTEPEAVVGDYVMITDQASFVSAIATNSVKDSDGKATGKFKLANDITISGTWNFTTIFRGELDGDGHTITFADGATITGGLFKMVSANAYIHDLQIAQAGTVTYVPQTADGCVNACLGGVAGLAGAGVVNGANSWGTESYVSSAANKVRFENVTVTLNMDVSGSATGVSVGGIVGEIGIYTEITNCTFNGYISDATTRSDTSNQDGGAHAGGTNRSAYGGIAGFGYREAVVVITECINNGNISGYGQEGGIFGAVSPAWGSSGTFKSTTIQRCINNGTITCNLTTAAGGVGGISAYLYGRRKADTTVNVLNNINNGTIAKAEGDAFIAGIVACVNRKEGNNVVTFAGNLQLSDNIGGGSQIVQQTDGSGDDDVLVYTNNFGRSTGNSTYSPLTYTKNYVDAYIALNAAYADTYVFRNNKVALAWADDAVFNTVTSVIGAQLSEIAGETRSIRMVAGTTDDLTVDAVGIEVVVYYGGEGAFKGFTGDTDTVYTSVYAAGVPVTAASRGVDYLYTATLDNVPTSVGTVTLLIRTFHEKGGETYYSDYTAMTLDLAS